MLKMRAEMLSTIRQFFAKKQVLEVETPLLGWAIGTDPELDYFATEHSVTPGQASMFLQTSPEFAMKRLLAAGSGCIYQICKAFRRGETGRFHNPEFTILEWYRLDFDVQQMMDETVDLLIELLAPTLAINKIEKLRYQTIFEQHTGIDPISAQLPDFIACARQHHLFEAEKICGKDLSCWLDFLFSHLVQPALASQTICLIYEYPACQAALARLNANNPELADRFEVFVNGVELGNGYFELADFEEQTERFAKDGLIRKTRGKAAVQPDRRFLAALKQGLPNCSGIAIGLDRVLMLMANATHIDEILSFPLQRA
jgi:lysyl-tRNA synthetase class 2